MYNWSVPPSIAQQTEFEVYIAQYNLQKFRKMSNCGFGEKTATLTQGSQEVEKYERKFASPQEWRLEQ